MTSCLALRLDEGLIFLADTRGADAAIAHLPAIPTGLLTPGLNPRCRNARRPNR